MLQYDDTEELISSITGNWRPVWASGKHVSQVMSEEMEKGSGGMNPTGKLRQLEVKYCDLFVSSN